MKHLFAIVAVLGAALLYSGPLRAQSAQARDYAYVFLQGKVTESRTGQPIARASVRLTAQSRTFEVLSDARGIFAFEKLPIEPYELRIALPDGKVIKGIQRSDPRDPDGMRFAIKLGKGYGIGVQIEATRERVTVNVAEQPTNWPRLWKQLAIFVGGAAVLLAF